MPKVHSFHSLRHAEGPRHTANTTHYNSVPLPPNIHHSREEAPSHPISRPFMLPPPPLTTQLEMMMSILALTSPAPQPPSHPPPLTTQLEMMMSWLSSGMPALSKYSISPWGEGGGSFSERMRAQAGRRCRGGGRGTGRMPALSRYSISPWRGEDWKGWTRGDHAQREGWTMGITLSGIPPSTPFLDNQPRTERSTSET